MEELARRRAELIMVEEEVKAKADGSARRQRRIGRMLAEAEGDCRSPGTCCCCCCSHRTRLHALRVEKSSRDADDEILRSFVEQMLEPRVVARYEQQGLPVCVFVAQHVDA